MPKIKTREKVKGIKALDRAAMAGRRLKNTVARTREQTAKTEEERQETPTAYAGERVQAAAHGTAQRAALGMRKKPLPQRSEKTLPMKSEEPRPMGNPMLPSNPVEQGRKLARRQAVGQRVKQSATALTIRTREVAENLPRASVKEGHRPSRAVRRRTVTAPPGRQRPTAAGQTSNAKTARQAAQRVFTVERQATVAAHRKAKKTAQSARAASETVKSAGHAAMTAARNLRGMLAGGGEAVLLVLVMVLLPGLLLGSCFGIFFSGEDSGTGQTMPMVVREINQELEDRLETIQSETPHDEVKISVSQARWPDVLAVYAVRTTTDPDNGQEVASMDDGKMDLLKRIFWDMNEISYSVHTVSHETVTDAEETETTLYITVSRKTAWEMADVYGFNAGQREQLAELLAEENRSLWNSVLYGIGTGDGEIVTVALSQLGNRGGEPYWSWYGFDRRVEWCACFVSWCADQCSYLKAGIFPRFSYCLDGIRWFQTAGLWQDRTFEPRSGDIIFFDWEDDGTSDHVGIVEKVENGMIYTVEGNVDDTCKQCSYPIGDSCICGFGTPDIEAESGN